MGHMGHGSQKMTHFHLCYHALLETHFYIKASSATTGGSTTSMRWPHGQRRRGELYWASRGCAPSRIQRQGVRELLLSCLYGGQVTDIPKRCGIPPDSHSTGTHLWCQSNHRGILMPILDRAIVNVQPSCPHYHNVDRYRLEIKSGQ